YCSVDTRSLSAFPTRRSSDLEVNRSHTEAMRKYNETARLEDAQARGFGEWIAHQCYWYDIPCPLTKVKTKYSDWLTIHGIDFDGDRKSTRLNSSHVKISYAVF